MHVCLLIVQVGVAVGVGLAEGVEPGPYSLSVSENASVGLVLVEDVRRLFGLSAQTRLKLGPGALGQFVSLDAATGRLRLRRSVDLEAPAVCEAEPSCCPHVNGEPRRRDDVFETDTNVNVDVDVNVNVEIGAFYGQSETTPDSPDSMEGVCLLDAFLLASATGTDQILPFAKLLLAVHDVNDNSPRFAASADEAKLESGADKKSASAWASEADAVGNGEGDGEAFVVAFWEGAGGLGVRRELPLATDADFSHRNRVVRYWLEGRTATATATATVGPFRLVFRPEGSVGAGLFLELVEELDREQRGEYRLRLLAEDGGGRRASLALVVLVLDVNEYSPVFQPVFPPDNGDGDGDVGIRLVPSPPDAAASSPVTPPRLYQLLVSEAVPVGTELARLSAVDRDAAPANRIVYSLGRCQPAAAAAATFRLDASTGSLSLRAGLDFERVSRFRLSVVATDAVAVAELESAAVRLALADAARPSSAERHSTTLLLDIRVVDTNDHAPEIRFDTTSLAPTSPPTSTSTATATATATATVVEVWVTENARPETSIAFFDVVDRDSPEHGRPQCLLTNHTRLFRLHRLAGLYAVQTVAALDRETQDRYRVGIRCLDDGRPTRLSTERSLLVRVGDENDLPPRFAHSRFAVRVAENSPPGTPLLIAGPVDQPVSVAAHDPDLDDSLAYRLEASPCSTQPPVNVNANGDGDGDGDGDYQLFEVVMPGAMLVTRSPMDREVRATRRFCVCADDGRHTSCAEVVVDLVDVNDNAPHFEQDTYTLRIPENEMRSTPLVSFRASDADIGNLGFTYDFANVDANVDDALEPTRVSANYRDEMMLVRRHFGFRDNHLHLLKALDREAKSHFHFFVQVTDFQTPIFATPPLLPSSPGNVSLAGGPADRRLGLRLGGVNLTGLAEVFVDVLDVNDNHPIFVFPNASGPRGNVLNVSCHETMGTSLGRVEAYDADRGANGTIVYSLLKGPKAPAGLVHLDRQSGELFVNTGQLAEACGTSLGLLVTADDRGPEEAKRSRGWLRPVEKLLLLLQDRPVLAVVEAGGTLVRASTNQRAELGPTGASSTADTGLAGYSGFSA
ncbi:unnamed protein product, partial [Protopolystoma xenopodis]